MVATALDPRANAGWDGPIVTLITLKKHARSRARGAAMISWFPWYPGQPPSLRAGQVDETMAFDDFLCHRPTHCTVCGRQGWQKGSVWCGVRDDGDVHTLAVTICRACWQARDMSALDGVLRERYGLDQLSEG
jgi:hypothetical protein